MKKDAKSEAIRYWWEKALESLEAARRDLAAEAFSFAINRAYYALFYAVSALLLEEGRRFEKHSGVRAAFNQHFIMAIPMRKRASYWKTTWRVVLGRKCIRS